MFAQEYQNNDESLKHLFAQRILYDKLKAFITVQYVVIFLISAVGFYLSVFEGKKIGYISFIFLLVDAIIIQRFLVSKQKQAALIQEEFDCDLYELPWNSVKHKEKLPSEDIERIIQCSDKNIEDEKLKNWYPSSAFSLPKEVGRLICQRSNISWNLSGRKRVETLLVILIVLIFLILVASLFYFRMNSDEVITKLVLPLSPLINRLREVSFRVHDGIKKLSSLQSSVISLWASAISNENVDMEWKTRSIQDEIFNLRVSEVPVFNWLYWNWRDREERAMNLTADKLAIEYNNSIK